KAARSAGFHVSVFGPSRLAPFDRGTLGISTRMSTKEGFKVALAHAARRHPRLRTAYLAWKTYVNGISVHLIGTKASPPGLNARQEESLGASAINLSTN